MISISLWISHPLRDPLYTINRGTTSKDFDVTIMNEGNVDLTDIEVELDLFGAEYFFSDFYYDEEFNALKQSFPLKDTIAQLNIGSDEDVTFPTSIFKYLPQGYYRIPLRMSMQYYNDGSTGEATEFVITDEMEYIAIRDTQGLSEIDQEPHINIRVENPQPSVDIYPFSTAPILAGTKNTYLTMVLENKEDYGFSDIEIIMEAGGELPIENPKSPGASGNRSTGTDLDPVIVDKLGSQLDTPANMVTVNFLSNVKDDASGVYEIPVEIKGIDDWGKPFNVSTSFELVVTPIPPKLVVLDAVTTPIQEGQTYNLTVTIMNVGGTTASSVRVLFIGYGRYTNTFSPVSSPIASLESLEAGAMTDVTFEVTADVTVDMGESYLGEVLFEYTDPQGTFTRFTDGEAVSFWVRTEQYEVPDPVPASQMLEVYNVNTGSIIPGAQFTMQASVRNLGDSTATNVKVLFVSHTNAIYIAGGNGSSSGIMDVGTLQAGTYKNVNIVLAAGENMDDEIVYTVSLLLEYTTSDAQHVGFDSNDPVVVELSANPAETMTESEIAKMAAQEAAKASASEIDRNIIILGIIIIIAAIIFPILLGKAFAKQKQPVIEQKVSPDMMPPPPGGPAYDGPPPAAPLYDGPPPEYESMEPVPPPPPPPGGYPGEPLPPPPPPPPRAGMPPPPPPPPDYLLPEDA